jgi:hypothetical protein
MEKLKIVFSSKIAKTFGAILSLLVVFFIILSIVRFFSVVNEKNEQSKVEKIHSTKLSIETVLNNNLKEQEILDDKTLVGVDSNNNNIRDDVEISIIKDYKSSARARAVLLQYALSLQMEVSRDKGNTTLATEIAREQSRGFLCVGELFQENKSYETYEKLLAMTSYVEKKQFNTEDRKKEREEFFKSVRSFSDLEDLCDIDLSELPN